MRIVYLCASQFKWILLHLCPKPVSLHIIDLALFFRQTAIHIVNTEKHLDNNIILKFYKILLINQNFMQCFEIPQHSLSDYKKCILMPEVEQIRLVVCFMKRDSCIVLWFSALQSITMKTGQNLLEVSSNPSFRISMEEAVKLLFRVMTKTVVISSCRLYSRPGST